MHDVSSDECWENDREHSAENFRRHLWANTAVSACRRVAASASRIGFARRKWSERPILQIQYSSGAARATPRPPPSFTVRSVSSHSPGPKGPSPSGGWVPARSPRGSAVRAAADDGPGAGVQRSRRSRWSSTLDLT